MKKIMLFMMVAALVLSIDSYSQTGTGKNSQKSSAAQTTQKKVNTDLNSTKTEVDKPAQADKVLTGLKGPEGQKVYEGPRGGQYYVNKNGNKTYLKPEDNVVQGKKGPDGQAVYSGPNGGQYYLNKNGNKTYLAPDKK